MDLDETWQVGLKPEKSTSCTFPAKSRYGFRREREKMGRRSVVLFRHVNHAPLLPLSFDRFSPNFPRTRVQVASFLEGWGVAQRPMGRLWWRSGSCTGPRVPGSESGFGFWSFLLSREAILQSRQQFTLQVNLRFAHYGSKVTIFTEISETGFVKQCCLDCMSRVCVKGSIIYCLTTWTVGI